MSLSQAALLEGASVVAGITNAVAGGGTLVSFPAAIAAGLTPLVANATNAVALTPGGLLSAVGYRREIGRDWAVVKILLPAAVLGGAVGSALLLLTPQKLFDAIVPLLVLFATGLLLYQNLRRKTPIDPAVDWQLPSRPLVTIALQFLVGVYGGYFGAGMGIMMLALYTRLGGPDIHRMNGVKSVLGGLINAIAAVEFVIAGAIDYEAALIMAVGSSFGGLLGAVVARRVQPALVRWFVVLIGLVLTVVLSYRRWVAHG